MVRAPFKSHERLILDATVESIFKHDLNNFGMQQRALGILNGAALALKAIGSQYVEGPIYPEFLRQGPVPDDSGVIATLTQVSPYGVPVMQKMGMHRGVDIEGASGPVYAATPVKPVVLHEPAKLDPKNVMTCGTCGHTYPDNTPAGRCPLEYEHADEPEFGSVEWRQRRLAEQQDARTPAEVASDIVEAVVAQRRRDRG